MCILPKSASYFSIELWKKYNRTFSGFSPTFTMGKFLVIFSPGPGKKAHTLSLSLRGECVFMLLKAFSRPWTGLKTTCLSHLRLEFGLDQVLVLSTLFFRPLEMWSRMILPTLKTCYLRFFGVKKLIQLTAFLSVNFWRYVQNAQHSGSYCTDFALFPADFVNKVEILCPFSFLIFNPFLGSFWKLSFPFQPFRLRFLHLYL